MPNTLKRTMLTLFLLLLLLLLALFAFTQTAPFGKTPSGTRLERVKASPHYRDGAFQNQIPLKPEEKVSFLSAFKEVFLTPHERIRPIDPIPSMKTDLKSLPPDQDVLIWLGHSSYFIRLDGKTILVDPNLSGRASPVPGTVQAFTGTDRYTPDDFPDIDYLFITHDHWDHLDYPTLTRLQPRIKHILCGLGTGEHLEYWGFDPSLIIEKDWNETIPLQDGFTAYTVPAQHFSGRGLWHKNQALWTAFVIESPTFRLFIGGDSGYGPHFADIGNTFGAFDLAILENGQYNPKWKYHHAFPAQTLKAAQELNARRILPVHSGKFVLSTHPWDEPLKTLSALNEADPLKLVTPIIGEPVYLKNPDQTFSRWWEGIR